MSFMYDFSSTRLAMRQPSAVRTRSSMYQRPQVNTTVSSPIGMTIGLWQIVLAWAVSPLTVTWLVAIMCWKDENIGIASFR